MRVLIARQTRRSFVQKLFMPVIRYSFMLKSERMFKQSSKDLRAENAVIFCGKNKKNSIPMSCAEKSLPKMEEAESHR